MSAGNLDLYAMDTYKPVARLTLTAGIRVTWNTNPVNQQGLFARPAGSFLDMTHRIDQPLNQVILTGLRSNFPATALFVYQPRVSAAYQLARKTAVHLGFGAFDDIIPAQIADLASINPPYSPVFVGGLGVASRSPLAFPAALSMPHPPGTNPFSVPSVPGLRRARASSQVRQLVRWQSA